MDKCGFCEDGALHKQTLPYHYEPWGDKTYRFEDVPAEICDVCGEIYFDADVSEAMDDALVSAEEAKKNRRFAKVPILDLPMLSPA